MLRAWAQFFGVDKEIDTSFYPDKFKKCQRRVMWKKRYSSVSDVTTTEGWWRRNHGRFRTIILVKKGLEMTNLDPGVEVSLNYSVTHDFVAKDRAEVEIMWDSVKPFQLFFLTVKFTTTLLRESDPPELEKMYTGQK